MTNRQLIKRKYATKLRNSLLSSLAALLLLAPGQKASALTMVLDFTSLNSAETIFTTNFTTDALDVTSYGFPASSFNTITGNILAAVNTDYQGFPKVNVDPSSPIPAGKELNINFEIGTLGNTPSNGDTSYFFMKIGVRDPVTTASALGHACQECVSRTTPPPQPAGTLVGSILSDNINGLSGVGTALTSGNMAATVNALAGTISHEIGHTLSLGHVGIASNPGASSYPLMGTGASPFSMPNSQRILDRAFSYAEASSLVTAVGLRDVAAVPLPASVYLFSSGILALLGFMKRLSGQTA